MFLLLKKVIRKLSGEDSYLFYLIVQAEYYWHPQLADVDAIVESFAEKIPNIAFVQIGSNDGKSGDPLHRHVSNKNWTGVMVEPVDFLFQQLKVTYASYSDRVHFEQAAISNSNGIQTFYRLKKASEINAPQWYDQLGSFNKEVILKHKKYIPHIESLIVEEKINTITSKDLLEKYAIQKLDFLHIDTEGYDYEIIKTFPFNQVMPKLIMFEHKHLKVGDFKKCISLLKGKGYILRSYDWDTVAVQLELLKELPDLIATGNRDFSRMEKMNLLRFNSLTP
jgi:FkbM family methyltransferase